MASPDPAPFEPKRLGRRDLEVPVTPGMRLLDPEARDRMVEGRLAWLSRFDLTGPRLRRRMKLYAIAGAIGFPVLNVLLTFVGGSAIGLGALWVQVPLAALYGVVIAILQPTRMVCAALFGLAGVVALWAAHPGAAGIGFLWTLLMHFLLYGCLGVAIGAAEEIKWMDGD